MGFWQLDTVDAAPVVADRTALKALDTSQYQTAFLEEAGRAGSFVFRSGNYSALVTADTTEGIYVKATDTASSAGAWVRVYSGPASVKWFGAKGDNSTADLASLQAATDLCDSVFIPNGTYKTNDAWLLDDYATLHFESRQAEISSTSVSAILRARGHTTTRNFYITIYSGTLRGTGTSGPVGMQFRSASMVKVFGTFITYCGAGIENGGAGAQGAFYNDFFGVDITTCAVIVRNGTLGNEIHFFGGRGTDCTVGTDDDDNTCNVYDAFPIETFTASGHRVSNSGSASQRIRYISPRMENSGGVGIGIDIKAAAQATVVMGEFYTGLATGVQDGGTGSDLLAVY